MKKILLAAVGVALASPAMAANSDNDSFQVNAQVAPTCTMENVNDVNLGQLAITTTAGSDALLLNSDKTGQTNQFWVSCNNTNTMTLTGDSQLTNEDRSLQAGDDAGFTDKLNYRVAAQNFKASGAQPSYSSLSGAENQTARGPVHRRVRLTAQVRDEDNSLRPLAGNYTGTVTVTVTAS